MSLPHAQFCMRGSYKNVSIVKTATFQDAAQNTGRSHLCPAQAMVA